MLERALLFGSWEFKVASAENADGDLMRYTEQGYARRLESGQPGFGGIGGGVDKSGGVLSDGRKGGK